MTFDSNPTAFLPDTNNAQLASRTTFFVDAGAGDDSNVGSFADPFQTIGRAIMQAKNVEGHNVINVRPGTYHENLNINDYGGLKIQGLGDQPYDVIVNGNANVAMRIDGAGWVGIENMMFAYGSEGIYANNVDQLQLYRVRSRNNMNDGLHARDINNLNISFSNFLENGLTGAHIISSNSVNIGHSHFDRSRANGLRLDQNESVLLRHVKANSNGLFDDDGPAVTAESTTGHGVAAFDNENLLIRGGYFNSNGLNGVEMQSNEKASLYSVHASSNQRHGVGGRNNDEIQVYDGLLSQNNGSGIWLWGNGLKSSRTVAAAIADFDFTQKISVNGTRLWDNGDEGLTLVNHDQVNLRNLHVRRNANDGVDVAFSNRVWMRAINTVGNGDDGIDIDDSTYVTAIDSWAVGNQGDGFDVDDGYMLNVLRGHYNGNREDGMDFNGNYERYLHQANIRSAVALNNTGSGLSLQDVNYANLIGGYFARNDHGIELYNVGAFDAQFVGSRFNRQNGLYSDTGVDPDDDNNDDNGNVVHRGSLKTRQSSFSDNQQNGILISSIGVIRNDQEDVQAADHVERSLYEFDVEFDRIVASRNQGSGVYFGSEEDNRPDSAEAAASYGGVPDIRLDVRFTQGNYSFNGYDGIRVEGQQLFSQGTAVKARASFDRTRVGNNNRYGLYFDNTNPSVNFYVQINRGWFNRNGRDGISISTVQTPHRPIVETASDATGHHEDESAWATLNAHQVVAVANGGNGLNFHLERRSIMPESLSTDTAFDGYHADLVANIIGGGFHSNGYSGLNLAVTTDELIDGNAGSRIYLERVFAKRNGQDGLTVAGYSHDVEEEAAPRGVQLQLVGGVFNRNQRDGLHLMNLGSVYLDRTRGIGNKDDGFDGTNLGTVGGSWVFVANEDEDFVTS